MKTGRFFVTSVVILVMAGIVACNSQRARERAGQAEHDRKQALEIEGKAKIDESSEVMAELKNKYNIILAEDTSAIAKAAEASDKFDWSQLSLEERRAAQASLARFLQAVNRVLEIASQKLMVLKNRDVIVSERESAEAFQRTLEIYVLKNGANFNPKREVTNPVHANND